MEEVREELAGRGLEEGYIGSTGTGMFDGQPLMHVDI